MWCIYVDEYVTGYLKVVPVGGEFALVEGPELCQVRVFGAEYPIFVPGHVRAMMVVVATTVVLAVVLHATVKEMKNQLPAATDGGEHYLENEKDYVKQHVNLQIRKGLTLYEN